MSPEARALAQALISHRRQVRGPEPEPNFSPDPVVITYGELCERAGLPHLKPVVGKFLREIAAWCDANGWPPLNSLAVNHETRTPGRGYDRAPGCSLAGWRKELAACLAFPGYPESV
ncbi:MAG TPA: hypothetical protein VNO43_06865 [Candidatus Eisenbacteria bacterium]|nr:hypothetical protein [Candidatus Eisenbacteria bacterium]